MLRMICACWMANDYPKMFHVKQRVQWGVAGIVIASGIASFWIGWQLFRFMVRMALQ